ncbi:MAG TPA: CopD family protein [Bryobacteraceae bacterium]|nr:CopD family protein [Bryobacteraceae bacterium]
MAQFIDLYGLIEVILRGLTLVFEAVTVGGIIFLCFCALPEAMDRAVLIRCRKLLRISAMALAVAALGSIAVTTVVLHVTTDGFRWTDVTQTSFCRAELLLVIAAVWIAGAAKIIERHWLVLPALAIITGATLTSHAFARIDNRSLLLFCTGMHHLATAAWIGGLPWLLITLQRSNEQSVWVTTQRFSQLAMTSVVVLVIAGIILGQQYVGSAEGIYGTSYGVMLVAKVVLLALLLVLGATNFRFLRRKAAARPILKTIVKRTVEAETAIGIVVILIASSMTSQPPAVDLTDGRASLSQIIDRFTPHRPRLQTPSVTALAPATPLNADEAKRFGRPLSYALSAQPVYNGAADIAWSEYNHNWAGICLLTVGLLALIAQMRHIRWARHWPLVFLVLAVFIVIRADPENWPLGPRGFWESFQVPDVMQHRLAAALVIAFAIFEWRVRTRRSTQSWHALVFPAICMVGGTLLFIHSHSLGNVKEELLAEVSHTGIAIFAIIAAVTRWLQLRLPQQPPVLGSIWAACFVLIGVLLTFYREA